MPGKVSFAVGIDLGSNTLRAVKMECDSGKIVSEYEKIVRTADGLAVTGNIAEESIERIVSALVEAKELIGFKDAAVRAVATEALRRASNSSYVLSTIAGRTGIRFDIIGGDEEARLCAEAVRNRLLLLDIDAESFVLADIGGGSTEISFLYGEEILSRSFSLGIVTLSQRYPDAGVLEELLPGLMRQMRDFISEIKKRRGRAGKFVAAAGTPTTIAALKLGMNYREYDPARVNGTVLALSDLETISTALRSISLQDREEAVGTGRADLIETGIMIFRELFHISGFGECIVVDDGLREGVAAQLCRDKAHD